MHLGNPFKDINNASPNVDRLLGESYMIVKAVYCELPFLKEILQSGDIQFFVRNFEIIKQILELSDELKTISSNIDEILNAPIYARQAKNSADLAKDWAIKMNESVETDSYSSKWYATESKEYAELSQKYADELRPFFEMVYPLSNAVRIVANNIDSVNTTAGSINSINVVAADLRYTLADSTRIDYGNISDPETPTVEVTGGNIVTVADNIDSINLIVEHLDELLAIASELAYLPYYVNQVKQAVQQTEKLLEEASRIETNVFDLVNQAKQEVINVTNEGNKQVQRVEQTGAEQQKLLEDKTEEIVENVSNAGIKEIQETVQKSIEQIEEKTSIEINSIKSAGTNEIERFTSSASTITTSSKQEIVAEGTKQVQAVKDQEALSIQVIKEQQTVSVQAVITEGTKQVNLAKEEVTKATEQVTLATNKANEANEQAERAHTEAERAKKYADQASTGQIQADWNQTDSEQKDYIKNKPNVALKSDLNSYVTTTLAESTYAKKSDITAIWKYKGEVETQSALPSEGNSIGDVWHVKDSQKEYVWKGDIWEELGVTVSLEGYLTEENASLTYATKDALTSGLEEKAPLIHTHTIENITGLQTVLNEKLGKTDKAESSKLADIANSVAWTNVTGTESVRTTATSITVDDLADIIDYGSVGGA